MDYEDHFLLFGLRNLRVTTAHHLVDQAGVVGRGIRCACNVRWALPALTVLEIWTLISMMK
jgi:hypothetical protein